MLILLIKKKWFDMIKSGEKKEDYREIKPYYDKRLKREFNICSEFEGISHVVMLRNGYSKSSPTLKCSVRIIKDYGKEEWGAEKSKLYYVLKILSVEEIKNENKDN